MPNRIIKESICTSDEIDSLTPEQEVFFYRLMVNCDDFGLFDARPKIVASKCYPLKSVDTKHIQLMLDALQSIGLVRIYEVDGRPYLSLVKWSEHQQIRAKRSKYPTPEMGSDITCNQLIADAPVIQSNPIQSESNPNPKQSRAPRFDAQAHLVSTGVDASIAADWLKHRKTLKAAPTLTAINGIAAEADRAGISLSDALAMCCQRGWRGFKAEWVANASQPAKTQHQLNHEATTRALFGSAMPSMPFIDGEVVR